MGTHPIFESDFDCLTENWQTRKIGFSLATFSPHFAAAPFSLSWSVIKSPVSRIEPFSKSATPFSFIRSFRHFFRAACGGRVCPTHNNDDLLFLCRLGVLD